MSFFDDFDDDYQLDFGGASLVVRYGTLTRKAIIRSILTNYTIYMGSVYNAEYAKQDFRVICSSVQFAIIIDRRRGNYGSVPRGTFSVFDMVKAKKMMKLRYLIGYNNKPPAFVLAYNMPEYCNLHEYSIIKATGITRKYIGW